MCMRAKSLQSCPTLCDPVNCSPPGSSVRGISQARVLEWVAPGDLPWGSPTQGSNLNLLCLLHWQAGSLPPVEFIPFTWLMFLSRTFCTGCSRDTEREKAKGWGRAKVWSNLNGPMWDRVPYLLRTAALRVRVVFPRAPQSYPEMQMAPRSSCRRSYCRAHVPGHWLLRWLPVVRLHQVLFHCSSTYWEMWLWCLQLEGNFVFCKD